MKVQPSKIILINSANCQYAEFNLSDSLHLVAKNNRGKTSIINTLQFLYIDQQKEFDIGYTSEETWKHYFPSLGSYVLFELNTLTGKKVFGLAATGLGRQPEKFVLNGAFQVEDFISQQDDHFIPRKPEQLFPQLGVKLLKRKLESKDHRDILRPFDKKKNILGLGLIGDTRNYRLFKQLFRQLLQLKEITIKDLKAQIERVNHRVMERERQINVQREFKDPYDEIQKRKAELQKLQSNQIVIEELLELSEEQKRLQGKLASNYLKSTQLFVSEESSLNEKHEINSENINHLKSEALPENKLLKLEQQENSNAENQRLGALDEKIMTYEKLEKACLQIVISLEQEKKTNFEKKTYQLQKQLFNVEGENLSQLEKALVFKQESIETNQHQLNGIADTLFAQLKKLLDDNELRKLYQLTNPELWGLFKNDGFNVQDTEVLKTFLRDRLKHVKDSVIELPGLSLKLSAISTHTLYQMGDPDFLKNKINSLQEEINRLEEKVTVVQKQEEIKQQLLETQQALKQIEKTLECYEQWEQGKDEYKKWITEKNECDSKIKQFQLEIDQLDDRKTDISNEIIQFQSSIQQLDKALREIAIQKKWIERHPPEGSWKKVEVNYTTPTFAELYERYKKQHEGWRQKSIDIEEKIDRLRSHFPAMLNLGNSQALQFLQQELDTIPAQEKSINDEWKRIFTTFASHCKGMIDSVDAINSYLVDLNRLLVREKISNLQSIKIIPETNQWYRHINSIKEWKEHDLPMFGGTDPKEMDRLLDAIKPLFEKVKISIADLYDLKLVVVDGYGTEKHYDNLQLESNGTSITAKTIIFISMINEAMKGKTSLGDNIRIPFYVDEIDSLDDINAENIHDTALKLGLIPIFASPKGSGICKRLYQLENNRGGKLSVRQRNNSSGKLLLIKPTFERVD